MLTVLMGEFVRRTGIQCRVSRQDDGIVNVASKGAKIVMLEEFIGHQVETRVNQKVQ